jgi:hypothetical protein
MNIILESIFGSHLYRLNTENSDTDFKGIILPSKDDILLGRTNYHIDASSNHSHSKNTKNDVDKTYYTLQYFIKLASQGETVALDMLHGNSKDWIISSEIWEYLVNNRHRFYTKSMESYIGYCRKQAAKYGLKGSRLGEIESMITFLNRYDAEQTIGNIQFYGNDFGKWITFKDMNFYEFVGSKFQDTLKVKYMIETLSKIYDKYGERSKLAKENKNLDFKAISHALRAGFQVKDIFTKGFFEYPLGQSEFLLNVKLGLLDFTTIVQPTLEQLVNDVYELSEKSEYPENVDLEFWNDFVKDVHLNIINS